MQLLPLVGAWFLGLWLADSQIGNTTILLSLIAIATVCFYSRFKHAQKIALAILLIAGGIGRMNLEKPVFAPNHIINLMNQEIIFSGKIITEPRWTAERQQITVEAQFVQQGSHNQPIQGPILVQLPPEPIYTLGQIIVLQGTPIAPKQGQHFNYAEYLARRDVYVLLNKPQVLAERAAAPTLRTSLLELKKTAQSVIVHTVPEPQAALLVGILLGIQSSVPPDVWNAFNRTGTSHILVISGWNISVIVVALLAFGKLLKWRIAVSTSVALGMIVIYVLLVGPSAAVVRAAVMGAIVACAAPLNRRADAWSALAVACWLMTVINPHTLWDLGFQLSALATASLFAWGKPIQHQLEGYLHAPWLKWMLEPLAATLAAQVWALPPILYHFGNLSIIAPIANILIGPAVPLAMAAGAVLVICGLIGRPLALLALPLTWVSLWWIIWIIDILAGVSWAAVRVPIFSGWWILGYYGLSISGWIWYTQTQPLQRKITSDASYVAVPE